MLSKSLSLLTPPLWHTPTDKSNATAWAVSLRTTWDPVPHPTGDPVRRSRAMDRDTGYPAVRRFEGWELREPLGRRVGRVSRIFLAHTGGSAHVEVALGPFWKRPVLLCPSTGSGWTRTPALSSSGRTADGRAETNRAGRENAPRRGGSTTLASVRRARLLSPRRFAFPGWRRPSRQGPSGAPSYFRSSGLPPSLVQDVP